LIISLLVSADPLLQGAIASGLSANHSLSDVAAICPSGSCIWNGYTTLGICSSVEDISSNLTGVIAPLNGSSSPRLELNTSLGPKEVVRYEGLTYPDSNGPCEFNLETLPNSLYGPVIPSDLPVNNLANVYIVYFPTCAISGNTSAVIGDVGNWTQIHGDVKNWKAFHGTVDLCLLNLSSAVTNATTTTTIVNRVDTDPFLWDYSGDIVFFPDSDNRPTFNITFASARSLAQHLFSMVNGSGLLTPAYNSWDNEWTFSMARDIYGGDPFVCSPEPVGGLPALGRRLNNVALSLTNA
jgi:hypothetical protein